MYSYLPAPGTLKLQETGHRVGPRVRAVARQQLRSAHERGRVGLGIACLPRWSVRDALAARQLHRCCRNGSQKERRFTWSIPAAATPSGCGASNFSTSCALQSERSVRGNMFSRITRDQRSASFRISAGIPRWWRCAYLFPKAQTLLHERRSGGALISRLSFCRHLSAFRPERKRHTRTRRRSPSSQFVERRHIGHERRTLRRRHNERADLARGHGAERRRHRIEREIDMSAKQILSGGRASPIGTCVIFTPASPAKAIVVRCARLPMPDDANVSVPGFALASARNSA